MIKLKRTVAILILLILLPSIVSAEDTIEKKKENPNIYLMLAGLSLAGGIYFISQGDSFESSHSDPLEYDQADVSSRADIIRRQGYLFFGVGLVSLAIWKVKSDQYTVSLRQQDGYPSLLIATRF